MTFGVSPGVYTREFDFTAAAQAQLTSNGSFAGIFTWGPVNEIVRVADEAGLVNSMGRPNNDSAVDFMTAASFLAFSNALDVVRIGNATVMKNAVTTGTAVAILNSNSYSQTAPGLSAIEFIAKYPGVMGNSIAVAAATSANLFESSLKGAGFGSFSFPVTPRGKSVTYTPAAAESLVDYFNVGDFLVVDGVRYTVSAVTATTLTLGSVYLGVANPTTITRLWQYAPLFSGSPAANTFHLAVIDVDGKITGAAGSLLAKYDSVSTVAGTKYADGTSSFYIDVINADIWLWVGGAAPSALNAGNKVVLKTLTGGIDGTSSLTDSDYLNAYGLFANVAAVDAPLIIGGQAAVTATSKVLGSYIIESIAAIRKDSVAFVSPALGSVVNNPGKEAQAVSSDRASLPKSSYGHMDGNWKYMYDKYNNVFRWVPCCGDSAGLYARVDREADTWFSAAGNARGQLKNVVKLAWNPVENERDTLYINDVNPIVVSKTAGPILFGDKTMLGRVSAFSRMNVRRLFIVLEKTISLAAENQLFEFNDEFTQRRFLAQTEPFMREVQGRRGVEEFKIVCDDTVNTPAVKQANQFRGLILVRPNNSINFIQLDFTAVGASVSFADVIGAA